MTLHPAMTVLKLDLFLFPRPDVTIIFYRNSYVQLSTSLFATMPQAEADHTRVPRPPLQGSLGLGRAQVQTKTNRISGGGKKLNSGAI